MKYIWEESDIVKGKRAYSETLEEEWMIVSRGLNSGKFSLVALKTGGLFFDYDKSLLVTEMNVMGLRPV